MASAQVFCCKHAFRLDKFLLCDTLPPAYRQSLQGKRRMSRRLGLENHLGNVCFSNALVFIQFRTLLRNGALATPLPSITSALFAVQRRGAVVASSGPARVTNHQSLSPSESALMSKHRVLPGFGRSWPPITPLESALVESASVGSLECALTKTGRGYRTPHSCDSICIFSAAVQQ